ncbi:MAG: FkbM family methyltransferase [Isosphaeraceae bacterium]
MGVTRAVVGHLPLPLIKWVSAARWRHPYLRRVIESVGGQLREGERVILRGAGRGLRFDPGQSNPGYTLGTSEPYVQDALARCLRPGMTVYDIGANVGFYAVIAAHLVGPSGRVVCFEPVPENATMIRRNLRANRFDHGTVCPQALGGSDGRARFLVGAETVASKLAAVSGPGDEYEREIEVEVRRLDAVTAGGRIPPPDFIKLDAEGAEAEILAGAADTVNAARPLMLIELHGTDAAVSAELSRLGYHEAMLKVEGPYCKYLLAAPAERPDLVGLIDSLCAKSRARP